MTLTFTAQELDYLRSEPLGRLATVDRSGAPQNNPVGFLVDEDTGQIVIGGRALGATRKFRNARDQEHVALVVDDLVSVNPWTVRGIEVRGTAEALEDVDPPLPGMSREAIRITPHWIGVWGFTSDRYGMTVRTG
jgi:pyridoxamine 5'-phosphate oxidase family protein